VAKINLRCSCGCKYIKLTEKDVLFSQFFDSVQVTRPWETEKRKDSFRCGYCSEVLSRHIPRKKRTKEGELILSTHFGKTVAEIAKAEGVHGNGVYAAINKYGFHNKLKDPVRRKSFWVKLHNDNLDLSVEKIAEKSGIKEKTVISGFYRYDLR